ncbi:Coiled-coil domain-containing protein r3hcc1l [Branchiostoma belcheri]|nr:Coiled-coil domain-containing protein r3hcc1l [Branchiostoma belcheri]
MPGELEPSKEKKMAQDWRRGQRSQELDCEDDRTQSMPSRTSAGTSQAETPARTRDRDDRQVCGKERENVKKTAEIARSTEEELTQRCAVAAASNCDETETLQNSKHLHLPEQMSAFKETPGKDETKDVSNVYSLEERQVIEDSDTVGQENVIGSTGTKSAEGTSSPKVPYNEGQSFSSFDMQRKTTSGFTDVKMSFEDNSEKTELCHEVGIKDRLTETKNLSSKEYQGDQSLAPEQTFNGVDIDSGLTVTKGIETEVEANLTLPATSTQLAGDKTPNIKHVPADTRNVTDGEDMTPGSETHYPEEIASSSRAGEYTGLTDKGNSDYTKETMPPELTTPENSLTQKSPRYHENDDEDNSEEFWDAAMDPKDDDVMTGQQEASCEDGQQGVAVAMETDEDSWDAMFDDDGECLNPDQMKELLAGVKTVKVTTQKPKHDYWNWKPKEVQLEEGYEHIVELSDFPSEFKTPDLVSALAEFQSQGFNIKWVDDTHALAVFSTCAVARRALQITNPLLRVKPMSEATQQSKKKAKNCAEFLQPFKPRPEASAMVARRLVSGALGVRASIPKEKREEERRKLKEAKERKRLEIEQRESAWEGR